MTILAYDKMNLTLRKLLPLMCFGSALLVFVYQTHVKRNTVSNLDKILVDSTFKGKYGHHYKTAKSSARSTRTIVKNYPSVISNVKNKSMTGTGSNKYIIFQCDGQHACGGWGDRQKGIVSAFLLANVTNRMFLINMTSPCNLNRFLVPNKYRWDMANFKLSGKTSKTIGGVRRRDYQKKIRFEDFNLLFPEDVIFLRSNADLVNIIRSNKLYKDKLPPWVVGKRYVAFRIGWNILFKPSTSLKTQIRKLLVGVTSSSNNSLVCAHIRIGKNPDMPNDSPNRNGISSVPKLWEFLQPYVDDAKNIFVATDSTSVRDMARMRFGKKSLDTGGKILHIDRQRKRVDSCEGFECAILDQTILTKCHLLVVSGSNFSIRAAFIRGSNRNLFIFKNGKVSPFVLP
ncbi:uncharacterized protein LOC121373854 [Gigantopelta aegis]|uniref:uncharacterized protein LOC121373854 n=1 Tax=Gigantopelta aegis TaxID=1735272 RepID=UPI001B887749|nr:uncharacterized protein LOC121373854 [Gigantopelta aegis]